MTISLLLCRVRPPAGAWVDQAACLGAGGLFFPGQGEPVAPAKAICAVCPVMGECRTYALGADERFGIWGGLSERERRRIRRAGHVGSG